MLGNLDAAQDIAAAHHHPEGDAERTRRHQVGRIALNGRPIDAEGLRAAQGLARQLDDDASIGGLRHGAIPPGGSSEHFPAKWEPVRRRKCDKTWNPAERSPRSADCRRPQHDHCSWRSIPSPTAKRTKPVTLIGPPTLPSASFSAWATDLAGS